MSSTAWSNRREAGFGSDEKIVILTPPEVVSFLMSLLKIQDLKLSYSLPSGEEIPILDIPDLQIGEGEQVALSGESGSGKTSLLNLLAGIQTPTSGAIRIDGNDIAGMSEPERDRFRATHLGYVFQSFQLLPSYSALENVLLGMMFGPGPDVGFATELLTRLGLADRLGFRPKQLSMGQRQRVALARALANRPRIVLADEPTGNLDPGHKQDAIKLMRERCEEQKAALLLVSHDPAVIARFERVVKMSELNRQQTVHHSREV